MSATAAPAAHGPEAPSSHEPAVPAAHGPEVPSSHRRAVFWVALTAALGLLVGGSALAVTSYLRRDDAAGTVRGYFAAVARGDAEAALGYGDLPGGSHAMLTHEVLLAQARIAPITDLSVRGVRSTDDRSADRRVVSVHYRLGWRTGPVDVTDDVALLRRGHTWRLVHAAVPVSFELTRAQNRAAIAGGEVPTGDVAAFPGAVPIEFDTPNLVLGEQSRTVRFAAPGRTSITVDVSPAGRTAAVAAVDAAVARCLAATAHSDPRCPLPDDRRAVPGTLRGAAAPRSATTMIVSVAAGADGLLDVAGRITITGRYARLDFDNLPVVVRGTEQVRVTARCYASAPDQIEWTIS